MMKNITKLLVKLSFASVLVIGLLVIGCASKPSEAPAEEIAPSAAAAPVEPAVPVASAEEDVVEELVPAELAQVDAVYRAQAAKEITPLNAESVADALAAEIEADIAAN